MQTGLVVQTLAVWVIWEVQGVTLFAGVFSIWTKLQRNPENVKTQIDWAVWNVLPLVAGPEAVELCHGSTTRLMD